MCSSLNALGLGKTPEYMSTLFKEVAEHSHLNGPVLNASITTKRVVHSMLDSPDDYKKLEGRCCIGTTAFFSKHRWHIAWESNADLLDCIIGSYHIPFYCQKIGDMKGVEIVDGAYGFAGTDLPHGDATLYVGIDPHAEITRTFTNAEMVSIYYAFFYSIKLKYAYFVVFDFASVFPSCGKGL